MLSERGKLTIYTSECRPSSKAEHFFLEEILSALYYICLTVNRS